MFRLSNLVMIQRSNIGMALLSIVTTQVTALSLVMIVGQMTAKMPGIGMILGPKDGVEASLMAGGDTLSGEATPTGTLTMKYGSLGGRTMRGPGMSGDRAMGEHGAPPLPGQDLSRTTLHATKSPRSQWPKLGGLEEELPCREDGGPRSLETI